MSQPRAQPMAMHACTGMFLPKLRTVFGFAQGEIVGSTAYMGQLNKYSFTLAKMP